MHMWVWYGYNLGDFLFAGAEVVTKPAFALTCLSLFVVGFLFEGSKVHLAKTQKNAMRRLYPHKRNDERRNLLLPEYRDAGPSQTPSRFHRNGLNVSYKERILINLHQTSLYLLHNVVGYLLMLAVMLYNAYLMVAVVLGMVAGYFIFGPMLLRLQTECFVKPACTDKCDHNAEGTTPPLLHTSLSSESDFFACETPSCSRQGDPSSSSSTQKGGEGCHYGSKRCPSKVAVAKKLLKKAESSHCHHDTDEIEKKTSHNVEDARLLRDTSSGCRASTPPAAPLEPAVSVVAPERHCAQAHEAAPDERGGGGAHSPREDSPQVSCCHTASIPNSESQQNML